MMHVNKSLPPVGIKLFVVLEDDSTLIVKRDRWVTNKDDQLEFKCPDTGDVIKIKRSAIRWMYM